MTVSTIKSIIYLVILTSAFISCLDEYDLNIDTQNSFVIVDAQIGDELRPYTIQISKSAIIGRGNDNIFDPISDAQVRVIDEFENAVEFKEKSDEPGSYVSVFQAIPNVSYYVDIQLSNGIDIKSRPEKVALAPEIDSLTFDILSLTEINNLGNTVVNDYIDVFANTTFEKQEAATYLHWKFSGVYEYKERYFRALDQLRCYIQSNLDINDVRLFNSKDLNGNVLKNEFILRTELDIRFNTLFSFLVEQYRITNAAYEYYKNINDLIALDGSLYDAPPGRLSSNLYSTSEPDQKLHGFFSIHSKSTKRLFISPSELGFEIAPDCSTNPSQSSNNPAHCFDCTILPNSSRIKPNYWPF